MEDKIVREQIEVKIEELERQLTSPGWSIWAILGAIASVVWIFLEFLKDFNADFRNGFTLAVPIFLIFISGFNRLWAQRQLKFQPSTMYIQFSSTLMRQSTKRFIFDTLIYLTLIFTISLLNCVVWARNYIIIIFSFRVIMLLLGLIYAFGRFPSVVNNQKKYPLLLNSISIFNVLAMLFIVLTFIWPFITTLKDFPLRIMEVQFGLLLALLFILTRTYINIAEQSPLLDTLRQLKHDLTFSHISPHQAGEQLELIIYGLKIEKYIDKELMTILNKFQEGSIKISRLNELLSQLEDSGESNDVEKIEKLQSITKESMIKIVLIIDEIFIKVNSFSKKILLIKGQTNENLDLIEFQNKIKFNMDDMKKQIHEFTERLQKAYSRSQMTPIE